MPAAVADPKRSLDSEQISPATVAHHTVYEKTPNLHQSHICQWGAQPYLVGPLSRLVGKPPFSPWLSNNVLPLKKAANGPNSAISLTQTFDRILFCVYNSLYVFWGTKSKKRESGDNRVYHNLKPAQTTHHTNRGILSAALSTACIVQKESMQEKSAQENVFGIDGVREEILLPSRGGTIVFHFHLVWKFSCSYYDEGKETMH